MKIAALLFALMLSLASFAADEAKPTAQEVMDAKVKIGFHVTASDLNRLDPKRYVKLAKITGLPAADIERTQGIEVSPRSFFSILAITQGRTSDQLSMLHGLAQRNASRFRDQLLPALNEAGLTSAASDLDEALKSIETSKTLERYAQDRFARLAHVALK